MPNEGQIVDVWEKKDTQYHKLLESLKGTEYFKQYHSQKEIDGSRRTDMKYYTSSDEQGVINLFRELKEEYYKILCVENGEVTHWMPIPTMPK